MEQEIRKQLLDTYEVSEETFEKCVSPEEITKKDIGDLIETSKESLKQMLEKELSNDKFDFKIT
jgi:hypothetical protein